MNIEVLSFKFERKRNIKEAMTPWGSGTLHLDFAWLILTQLSHVQM
jgi:hypothetical protein